MGITYTPDPTLAETIRQAIQQHVASLNARAADVLDATADQLRTEAGALRGVALEVRS